MPDDSKKKGGEGKGHKNKRTADEHPSEPRDQTGKTDETKNIEKGKAKGLQKGN